MSKDNFSVDELLRLAKAMGSNRPEDMLGAGKSKLSDDKKNELQRVLSDKKALEELLNSEQAQRLIRQFKGASGQNGK